MKPSVRERTPDSPGAPDPSDPLMTWLTGDRPARQRQLQLPPIPRPRLPARWPLLLIGAPAAVAIWSGWVGLGGMCGFGLVHPLPGIAGSFELNTAITLPVGVEAYGTYALRWWLDPDTPVPARRFARWSAIGSLALGMAGQIAYHLLVAAGWARAPWPVTIGVSCVPVIALGFGAALAHLLRQPDRPQASGVPEPDTPEPEPPAGLNGHAAQAREIFAELIAAGQWPGIRPIKDAMGVGQPKAKLVRAYLRQLAEHQRGRR